MTASFPESWVTEMSQTVAAYLLAHFDGVEVPIEVEFFLGHLRGDLANAAAQASMFEAQ